MLLHETTLTADVSDILSACHHQQIVAVCEPEAANDAMTLRKQTASCHFSTRDASQATVLLTMVDKC
jgi:hypothetical protein